MKRSISPRGGGMKVAEMPEQGRHGEGEKRGTRALWRFFSHQCSNARGNSGDAGAKGGKGQDGPEGQLRRAIPCGLRIG